MSKILKRPMFRKGGQVMEGVMKLASGGRAKYQDAGRVTMQDLMKDDPYLQEVYDIASAGYGRDVQQERSDVLANLLIRGGLGLVSGEGAGKGTLGAIATAFRGPTEQALAEMSKLKQDPAAMLTAKTALEQKGAERLQRLKNQQELLDAQKKAKVVAGPKREGESDVDYNKRVTEVASQIIMQPIKSSEQVQQRSEEGQKQSEIFAIADQLRTDLIQAKKVHNLFKNADKIKEITGLELGPNYGDIRGQEIKGRLDYNTAARNAPDGIYYDTYYQKFIKIQSGIPEIIDNPLNNVKEMSGVPNTETKPVQVAQQSITGSTGKPTRKQRRDARRSPEVEEIKGPTRLTRFQKRQNIMGG